MTQFDYDYFVIGAGSGGVRSARIAASHGARVAIAEEYRVGGTCVIRGCVPKKLLVFGAHFADDLEDARHFGWEISGKSFNWKTLRDNVLSDVDRLNTAYQTTLDTNAVTTFHGRATIVGPHRVHVTGRDITARHVLVATGAHPHIPDLPGAELGITSNEMFHLDALPRRAVIVGAGFIANEFAGILCQLGVEVTLVVRSDTPLRGWDRDIVDRLMAVSTRKGIHLRLNASPKAVKRQADGSLQLEVGAGDPIEADLLLWATGRVPNTRGLGLETVGLEVGGRGEITVDADNHSSLPWLHAVGDVTDRIQLTPIAIREGHALADRLFGDRHWQVDHALVPAAVFSHPPLAAVGLTEADARASYGDIKIFTSEFRPMKNVVAGRNERAFYKLVVDAKTDRLLGAHMIGPEAPEMLQLLAIAVKAGLTKAQIDSTIALHPTMAEELVLMK